MKAKIERSILSGIVEAPPSKSMAHRLIIAAALSEGECKIENVSMSEDISATSECMKKLGKEITFDNGTLYIKNSETKNDDRVLFVNESGSTLRFLIPLCLTGEEFTIKGSKRLFERPLSVYEEIFEKQNIKYEKGIDFIKLKGTLKSGNFKIRGDISSQFITGLLYALPLLEGDSKIEIIGNFESKNYCLMTLSALKAFGVDIYFDGDRVFRINGGQKFKSIDCRVEGDWSNAAFFDCLGLFGHDVSVTGLDDASLQGDKICKEYFMSLKSGCPTLSVKNCPDLAPILFTVAAFFNGGHFTDTARLKIKESDRAEAMKEELSKFGADISVSDNEVFVNKTELHMPTEPLSSHNDHRIAMSLAVLATRYGGEIEEAEAVRKSFPDFYEILKTLGAKVEAE